MNPYDFVPIDFTTPPDRQAPLTHEKFQGLAGRLTCRLTAETPIFIPENREKSAEFPQEPIPFITRNHVPVIPGSSLKGLIRNLAETVGNGCFVLFDGTYERRRIDYTRKLPPAFHRCDNAKQLCVACRMFGMLEHREVFLGHVSISDALTQIGDCIEHQPIYTKPLMEPKPRHTAFYSNDLHPKTGLIAGRKFYFHSPRQIQRDTRKTPYNQYICPLGPGSRFTFTVDFSNLRTQELAVLLYALVLEPQMRHKIGLAKPMGLGSVKIEAARLSLIDYEQRYTAQAGRRDLDGSACEAYIAEQIHPLTSDATSPTLAALRRIWAWNPDDETPHVYPGQGWFKSNPQARIAET